MTQIKERPILFSAEMVRAILGGWPEDTHKWLRIISNGIDHDALLFEAEEFVLLQAG